LYRKEAPIAKSADTSKERCPFPASSVELSGKPSVTMTPSVTDTGASVTRDFTVVWGNEGIVPISGSVLFSAPYASPEFLYLF